jgi:hypothetical protein
MELKIYDLLVNRIIRSEISLCLRTKFHQSSRLEIIEYPVEAQQFSHNPTSLLIVKAFLYASFPVLYGPK